jgi:micrococcal nuclease
LWLLLPLLFLLTACSEEGFVLPSPLQTPLAASLLEAEEGGSSIVAAQANFSTYLYSGPGRFYEEAGTVFPGQTLRLTGQNESGDWYRLADSTWINALAVVGRPELPVVTQVDGRVIAQVVEVLDGDTITVSFNDRNYEVRYLLSVAPQVEQAFGPEAYEWNLALLDGQTVLLEADVEDTDAYGRLLRYVYLAEDESMVNEAILREGLAQVAVFQPNDKYADELRRVQAEAEFERRGLWGAEVVPYRENLTGCTYTVQPAESVLVIAKRFGVTIESLAQANEIADPNFVQDGTVLTIPGCGQQPTPPAATPEPEASVG